MTQFLTKNIVIKLSWLGDSEGGNEHKVVRGIGIFIN